MKRTLIILIILVSLSNVVLAETNSFRLNYNLQIPDRKYKILKETSLYIPEFHVKGIYVTGWVAGDRNKINKLISVVNDTVLNTMVIDIKDSLGYLSYKSKVPLANEIKAYRRKIKDVRGLINKLHNNNIYTIARIVLFKDKTLANSRPDLALSLWDPKLQRILVNKEWVDPGEKEVWDYNIALAREAVAMGFDEIQFDYIRYPAMANSPYKVILPFNKGKSDVIQDFAYYAKNKLKDLNVPISIDVFGLTTTVKDDLGIGQNFRELVKIINIISPMVYPSHYAPGSFGIELPVQEPYQIISRSMRDALRKVGKRENIIVRPWLQDFSLHYRYTQKEIKEQIRAVENLGLKEWLLWNPRSQYTVEALFHPPN